MYRYFVIIVVVIFDQAMTQDEAMETCEYSSCPRPIPGYINVHIVPHTHNDVGWLHTAEEYYNAAVHTILNSVVKELWKDPKRKFTYVESYYFFKWWNEQSEDKKKKVRILVEKGRLQFAGGGWTMNDEATTYYQSIIDQFTYGLNKITDTFGVCASPRIAWQIDSFGHSREFASLLAAMGFHGQILGRINYQDKENRQKTKTMEMLWRGDDSLGEASDIYTGILNDMYWPPQGFCFDKTCVDDPIIDDSLVKRGVFNNVKKKIRRFSRYVFDMASNYKTNNLLVPMGHDFHYQDSEKWFTNLDKLIRYNNADKENRSAIKMFYSTPQCYLRSLWNTVCPKINRRIRNPRPKRRKREALKETLQQDRIPDKAQDQEFPSDEDDFYSYLRGQKFPMKGNSTIYNARGHLFSTYEYEDSSYQKDEKFSGDEDDIYSNAQERMSPMPEDEFKTYFKSEKLNDDDALKSYHSDIDNTFEKNGSLKLMKYDDFFPYASDKYSYWTGYYTSRPALKYFERQANSYLQMVKHMQALGNLDKANMLVLDELKSAMGIMQHHEAITGTSKQYVTDDYVRILSKAVEDARVIPRDALRKFMKDDSLSLTPCRLNESSCYVSETSKTFVVTVYNPLAWRVREPIRIPVQDLQYTVKTYNGSDEEIRPQLQMVKIPRAVQAIPSRNSTASHELVFIAELEPLSFTNYYVTAHGDLPHSLLNAKMKQPSNTKDYFKLKLEDGTTSELFMSCGYFVDENTAPTHSGAYLLHAQYEPRILLDHHYANPVSGPIVEERTLVTEDNIESTFRRYVDLGFMENDWVVGPINISDGQGKEYIVYYKTKINHKNIFYTDSNGRQLLERELGVYMNDSVANRVGASYYPVTNQITVKDNERRFSVLTDRSEGGSLSWTGIELMLHRRLLKDDGCGVEEALDETFEGRGLVVRGQHRLILSKNNNESIIAEKKLVKQFNNRPQVFVSDASHLQHSDLSGPFSFAKELPEGLHLLTLEPWGERLLIRLENYLEISDREISTIEIDLRNIFTTFNIKSFKETTLAANRLIEDWNHLTWTYFKKWIYHECAPAERRKQPTGFNVEIKAKQIRTFIIDYEFV